MKITNNFRIEEFHCHDGTQYPTGWIKERLLPLCEDLEKIRELSGPLKVASGYRTEEYNKKIGGSKNSQHIQGVAADLHGLNSSPNILFQIIIDLIEKNVIKDGGVGRYSWGVHYDHGPARRWSGK